jgi:hypothetical protein
MMLEFKPETITEAMLSTKSRFLWESFDARNFQLRWAQFLGQVTTRASQIIAGRVLGEQVCCAP